MDWPRDLQIERNHCSPGKTAAQIARNNERCQRLWPRTPTSHAAQTSRPGYPRRCSCTSNRQKYNDPDRRPAEPVTRAADEERQYPDSIAFIAGGYSEVEIAHSAPGTFVLS